MGQELDSLRSGLAAAEAVAPGIAVVEVEVVGGPVQGTGPSGHDDHGEAIYEEGVVVALGVRSLDLDTACLGDPVWDLERQELEWAPWLALDHTDLAAEEEG